MGYSPWGCKQSDTTEWLTLSLTFIANLWLVTWVLTSMGADFSHVRVFKFLSPCAKPVSIAFHLLQLFAISSSASGGDSIPLLPNFGTLLLFLQLSNVVELIMITQVTLLVKSLFASAGDARDVSLTPGLGRFPGGGNGNPLQYSCLGKSHRQRRLVGYHPWGCTESDMTEHKHISVRMCTRAHTHTQHLKINHRHNHFPRIKNKMAETEMILHDANTIYFRLAELWWLCYGASLSFYLWIFGKLKVTYH